jgi:signal transduction histidine kinase
MAQGVISSAPYGAQDEGLAVGAVLLLDDRPEDRDLMAALLCHAGHGVIEAASDEEALRLAREWRPELIIADILMSGVNGYEFMRRLREDPDVGAAPVIFCTATYLEAEVRELAASCGVSRFISKPCPAEVVLATVAEALTRSEPLPLTGPLGQEFEREQLRVINDELVEKVTELERACAHRRQLLGLVMSAQEQERRRIADGIRGDSLQSVFAVSLGLARLRRRVDDAEAIEALERLQTTVKLASQRPRSLLFELLPPELEDQGLVPALRAYLEHAEREEGLGFALDDQLSSVPDHEMRTFLLRIAQEILMNVRRHAHASRVEVSLTARDGRHVIRVRDDGVGIDVAEALRARAGHLGLAALNERLELAGGVLRIESAAGAGATVEFEVPAQGTRVVSNRDETYPAETRA